MFNLENYKRIVMGDRTYYDKKVTINTSNRFEFVSIESCGNYYCYATINCYVVNGYGQLEITFSFTNTEKYVENKFEFVDEDFKMFMYLQSNYGNRNNLFMNTTSFINNSRCMALKYNDYRRCNEMNNESQAIDALIDAHNSLFNTRVIGFINDIVYKCSRL